MADELEVRVTITRKASTEHAGADVQIANISTEMNSADRERFLGYLVAKFGLDADGIQRDVPAIVGAYWSAVTDGTVANIESWEKELAAAAARAAVTPIQVTQR